MTLRRATLLLALVLLGALGALRVRADALDDRLAKARADAVRGLEETAAWATEHRLIGGRHRALRRVLRFAPDHALARAVLEYAKSKKDGRWVQASTYREPADWNKDALPEYERRVKAVLTAFRNDALVALEEAGDAAGARREATLDELAALLPDDETVRKARGDVRLGARWVMPETAKSVERRAELAAFARDARASAKPPVPATGPAAKGWSSALRAGDVTVFGSLDAATCRRALDLCQTYPAFFAAVFGPSTVVEPTTYYLLRDADEAARVFASHDDAANGAKLRAAGLGGGWLSTGETFLAWSGEAEVTIQMVVRATIDSWSLERFHHDDRGWVSEGVGRVLSWHFAGFAGTPIVSVEETQLGKDDEDEAVPAPTGDWLVPAREVVRKATPRRLAALLTMRLTAMRTADTLLAYALAAYLLEGAPDRTEALIEATVESDDAEAAVRKALGFGVESLLLRLRRWTEETAAAR